MGVYSAQELMRIRRSRRHPRPTQFDYVHVRRLVSDLETTLRRVAQAHDRVLDIYCGSRPYDDLLPPTAEIVGLDVTGNPYGVADVVSDEFLPFPDASFDLAMCIQAFDYVPDPRRAVAEIRRVLRPGGSLVLTIPLVWEYDRRTPAHRYSGPDLATLFDGWRDVEVIESGGRAVAWATLTGSLVAIAGQRAEAKGLARLLRPVLAGVYGIVNALGLALDAGERRYARGPYTLPMNLLLCARSPEMSEPS
jgi:SAM-dependent methyltransferase